MFHSGAAVSQELKVVFLNINGLLHANHSEDLDSDYNFEEDLICVAESSVLRVISISQRQFLLSYELEYSNCDDAM